MLALILLLADVEPHPAFVEVRTHGKIRGGGFRVSAQHVLTVDHVVDTDDVLVVCRGVAVRAHVVAAKAGLDLAILALDEPERCSARIAAFRADKARKGEWLGATGCPRRQCGETSSGNVHATWILHGRRRMITTLPVRGGGSGSPVYDKRGDIVGIVVGTTYVVDDRPHTYGVVIPAAHIVSFMRRAAMTATEKPT